MVISLSGAFLRMLWHHKVKEQNTSTTPTVKTCSKLGCVEACTLGIEYTGLEPERKFGHKSSGREAKTPAVHM